MRNAEVKCSCDLNSSSNDMGGGQAANASFEPDRITKKGSRVLAGNLYVPWLFDGIGFRIGSHSNDQSSVPRRCACFSCDRRWFDGR
jgi:hypothetical protein